MVLPMIAAALTGLSLGTIIGHAKFQKPLLGAVFGAGLAAALVFAILHRPSAVLAVESFDDFQQQVLRSTRPALVDFYSDRCAPCKRLAPTLEKLAEEYKGRIDFVAAPEIAHRYAVRAIPNVMLFLKGNPTYQWVGPRPIEEYRTVLETVLAGH